MQSFCLVVSASMVLAVAERYLKSMICGCGLNVWLKICADLTHFVEL